MDKLHQILKAYVADGSNTKDRLLGASFVVLNADGEDPLPLACIIHLPTRRVWRQVRSIKVRRVVPTWPWTLLHGPSTP